MAVPSKGNLRQPRGLALALLVALASLPVCAQPVLTLEEVGRRNAAADFVPAHLGQKVTVSGVVNSSAFRFPTYALLAIEYENVGAVLQLPGKELQPDSFRPGDRVEA